MSDRKLLVNGRWLGGTLREIRSPYDGRLVSQVHWASAEQAVDALKAAAAARSRLAELTTGTRRRVLHGIVDGLRRRASEIAEAICDEAGKPISAARVEVSRAIETFTLAASEVSSFGGRTLPIDFDERSAGYECETRLFPAGVVVGIVPFNFPLNLGAHKIAPALAVGCPIIVKPPPQAPSAMLIVGELALEAGADPAALQVLPCDNDVAEKLATDPRVRVLSFTGSAKVGWELKKKAPGQVLLELGGNAGAIVCADADQEWAADRIIVGGFVYAGQVCIKVQRAIIEAPIHGAFVAALVERAGRVVTGDPREEKTVIGPVIDDRSAERIERWMREAIDRGACVLAGGRRKGRMFEATILSDVPRDATAYREEIFGPVLIVERADSFEAAIDRVNDSAYGLQAAVFTRDLLKTRLAFHRLEVGGVIVNEYPTFRADNFPYGGVKASGLGREGVAYAMRELCEERVLVTRSR